MASPAASSKIVRATARAINEAIVGHFTAASKLLDDETRVATAEAAEVNETLQKMIQPVLA